MAGRRSGLAVDDPFRYATLARAVDALNRGPTSVLLVAEPEDGFLRESRQVLQTVTNLDLFMLWRQPGAKAEHWSAAGDGTFDDKAPLTLVCKGRTCGAPIFDPLELACVLKE